MKKLVNLHSKFSSLWFKVGKSRIPLKPNLAYNSINNKDDLCDAPRTKQGETPTKASHGHEYESEVNPKDNALLSYMKSVCETKKPGVKVELEVVKGKEKGRVIVEEAKLKKATLLVLGHRRRCVMWRLLKKWRGKKKKSSNEVADYCIQNANCMTIAVRRKSRKLGGYLITTKRHKNFWLLA
ncbi:hypothetical protein V2J09_020429 [Rumex salicifolius]